MYLNFIGLSSIPQGYWNDTRNHKHFAEYLSDTLGYKCMEDWYTMSASTIKRYGGMGLLVSKYKGRTLEFIEAMFPEYTWLPWLFTTSLNGIWSDTKYVLLYLEWIKPKINWTKQEDYYKLTTTIVSKNKGGGLLNHYNHSVLQLLNENLNPPEGDEEWYPWLFDGSTPNNYWDDIKNRKKYADWLFKRLGFTQMEDWYSVTQNTFRDNYGSGLILSKLYNSSHINFLEDVYKDTFTFYPWCFKQTPQGFWQSMENRIRWMKYFSEMTGRASADQLYDVSREEVKILHGAGLTNHYYKNDFAQMIIDLNPHLTFDKTKFNVLKTEAKLERYLISKGVLYKKQYYVIRGKKNGAFKVDFLLLDLNIAIELDGPQHFRQIYKWIAPDIQISRDIYKMRLMVEKGIRCIRLLQEEVLKNNEEWLDTYILPLFTLKETYEPAYICIDINKYGNIYEKHKSLYISNIKTEELSLYNDDDSI